MMKRTMFFAAAAYVFWSSAGWCAQGEPVVIYGDSQHDHAVHKRIVSAVLQEKPVAVFQLGDLVDDGEDPQLWKIYNEITDPLRAVTKFYPCLGNHERNAILFYENFELPNNERWYEVEAGGIRFIVLDSNAPLAVGSPQYQWLIDTLSRKSAVPEFTVALFHHPLFTSSASHFDDERNWRPTAIPLFQEYGVNAVFSGHSHNYERLKVEGIFYIVAGGAGSHLFDRARQSPHSQVFARKYHYCVLVSSPGVLRVRVIDVDGAVIDAFEIPSRRLPVAAQKLQEVAP